MENLTEACWEGYKQVGMKDKSGKMVPNCVPINEEDIIEEYCPRCLATEIVRAATQPLEEAEYHGRKVSLGKPMRGDVKKFKVFVKDPSTGNVKKVNFGDKTMRIKKMKVSRKISDAILKKMKYTFNPEEFHMGMNVEMEHQDVTNGNVVKTAKIAAAHLTENPKYYTLLKKYVEK